MGEIRHKDMQYIRFVKIPPDEFQWMGDSSSALRQDAGENIAKTVDGPDARKVSEVLEIKYGVVDLALQDRTTRPLVTVMATRYPPRRRGQWKPVSLPAMPVAIKTTA